MKKKKRIFEKSVIQPFKKNIVFNYLLVNVTIIMIEYNMELFFELTRKKVLPISYL